MSVRFAIKPIGAAHRDFKNVKTGSSSFPLTFIFPDRREVWNEPVPRSHVLQTVHQLEVLRRLLRTELVAGKAEELEMTMWFLRMVGLGILRTVLLLQFIHPRTLR